MKTKIISLLPVLATMALFAGEISFVAADGGTARPQTFCNPLDLPYRFQLENPSRREAADPTLVRFNGEYWLFASKSGGYWHSSDMMHWQFVTPTGLPLEDYAPTVAVLNGRMIFTAFNTRAIFTTDDPLKGIWRKAAELKGYPDPDIFVDDDGRVFIYYGCDSNGKIRVVELDPRNEFKVINGPVTCFAADYAHHGWEVSGEDNRGNPNADGSKQMAPWLEGSWMTKHARTYYLTILSAGDSVSKRTRGRRAFTRRRIRWGRSRTRRAVHPPISRRGLSPGPGTAAWLKMLTNNFGTSPR